MRAPDKSTSIDVSTKIGRIACDKGMSVFVNGKDAISEISKVVTRSEISNSPNCRFPMKRIIPIRAA